LAKIKNAKVSARIAIVIVFCIFSLCFTDAHAQTAVAFNPGKQFPVPEYNGSISFALNGTYSTATFEDNTWTFTDLNITHSQLIKNFQISTQNSNVTIRSYAAFNNSFQGLQFQSVRLGYVVNGQGKQILNLGVGPGQIITNPSEQWSVFANNKSLAEGSKGWSISQSGVMTVNGATGNVTITFVNFSNFGGGIQKSNLPFYQQHSVAIAVVIGVTLVVVVAVVVKVRNREKPESV